MAQTTTPVSTKIYIAGLSWSTDERQLRDLFATFGPIDEVELIKDNYTGQSRGFAFITYKEQESAARALALHGHVLDRRPLTVDFAVERDAEERRERRNARREIDIKTQAYEPKLRSKH